MKFYKLLLESVFQHITRNSILFKNLSLILRTQNLSFKPYSLGIPKFSGPFCHKTWCLLYRGMKIIAHLWPEQKALQGVGKVLVLANLKDSCIRTGYSLASFTLTRQDWLSLIEPQKMQQDLERLRKEGKRKVMGEGAFIFWYFQVYVNSTLNKML